jgi:hypothetical protein
MPGLEDRMIFGRRDHGQISIYRRQIVYGLLVIDRLSNLDILIKDSGLVPFIDHLN